MYLKKIRLQNIKCFEDVTLEFPHADGDYSGWNVILGENGLGKTSIVRAIAELVMEAHDSSRIDDDDWVAFRAIYGTLEAFFLETRFDDPELWGSGERIPGGVKKKLQMHVNVEPLKREWNKNTSRPKKVNTPGWLACGYGPFRRVEWRPVDGRLSSSRANHHELPFITLLNDAFGIVEPFSWLKALYARSLDHKVIDWDSSGQALKVYERVINQLLPRNIRLKDVSTEKVLFETAEGVELETIHLSDGFRSFLALVLDLLMHVYNATSRFADYVYEDNATRTLSILAEGVVLIDEADAHLHPSWQRELGERLRQVFPKIQFIVTTHSPFIAQEAIDGGMFVLRRNEKGTVDVEKFGESVRGWTATQILTSPLFGLHSTRSVETEELVRRNTVLLGKPKLTAGEKRELTEIKAALETRLSAPGETYEEMRRHEDMSRYVDDTLKRLRNGSS